MKEIERIHGKGFPRLFSRIGTTGISCGTRCRDVAQVRELLDGGYTREIYRALLKAHGVEASMSHTSNCYDNAVVESFWGKLKMEMVHHQPFASKEEARAAVFEYIEMFYTRIGSLLETS